MTITIAEFNELYKGKFRLLQLKNVTKNVRFALQEWCPGLNQWNHKLPRPNLVIYRDGKVANAYDSSRQVPLWVFDELDHPSVILDTDEYGTQVWAAMNTEQATLSLLKILQSDRFQRLLEYRECSPPANEPKRRAADFPDDVAIQNLLEDQWVAYKRKKEHYDEYVALKKEYERAIETREGLLAIQVLESLCGGDEKVEFKDIEIVKVDEHAHSVSAD